MQRDLEPPPAIRQIETDRPDMLALELVGHITAADIENAYGLLEAAYQLHDKIDVLVRVSDYEGFDWQAVLSRTTFKAKSHALKHIRRYAVVGGPGWLHATMSLFNPLTPVESRHFNTEEEAAAWEWIGAKPKPL